MNINKPAANDSSQVTNDRVSLALRRFADGTFVVSAFAIKDGCPDTDGGEILVRDFSDPAAAKRLYLELAGLMHCKVAAFDTAYGSLSYWLTSLASAHGAKEICSEMGHVRDAMVAMKIATLARRDPSREERRAAIVARAAASIAAAQASAGRRVQG